MSMKWLDLMELPIGEEVMILPLAGQPGQGLQGILCEVVATDMAPVCVIIRQSEETPLVTIPWSSILMITKASKPAVRPEPESPGDISVAELVEMAEQMGLTIPEQIQAAADAEQAEQV
jgi:hypothetical protein